MNWIKNTALLLILMVATGTSVHSQTPTRYLIIFKNKGGASFSLNNPAVYLAVRSIERRTRYGIALDSTDLPVTPAYIDSIRNVPNVTVLNASKWLNQVSIQTTDPVNALNKINTFPFVVSATPLAARIISTNEIDKMGKFGETSRQITPQNTSRVTADFYNYGLSSSQINIHNGQFLHNIGLRGQNMIIGMLDAGYQNYLTVKAFDSARANGQILGTYDFVDGETSVNEDNAHGMQCLSTIAANIPGQFVGTAPKALFYLFRTEESATEYPIEEHNWVCGAERVDSAGGDVISSSLGYYDFQGLFNTPAYNHTYADMNGNTTMPAKGADFAAKKGILVVNAAGNEGTNAWRFIITPADGDSVLAVGAVNGSGAVASFSSYGPSSDGQVKPDVASVGVATVVQQPSNVIGTSNGTSFACPNIAGLTTCLWQGFPEFNNMKIINALRQSGSIATMPNDRIGYGIPDVKKALLQLTKDFSTASATTANCNSTLNWTSKDVAQMKYEIERKAPGETEFTKLAERFGTGTAISTHTYQYIDDLNNMPQGIFTYRIRQIIDTSASGLTADYIDTIFVNLTESCISATGNMVVVAPNPAINNASVRVTTADPVQNLQVRITDILGKTLTILTQSKGVGTTVISLPIAGLAKGKYFVSAYANGKLIGTRELLKL